MLVVSCDRPPIERPAGDSDPISDGTINLEGFINDHYALGAKWYDYSNQHVVTAKDEIYLVADRDAVPTVYYAVEVTSFHHAVSAESGNFTIEVATWGAAAWGASLELALSHTVYYDVDTGDLIPICVDLAGPSETDCAGDTWQLMFTSFAYLAPISIHPLGTNPGIIVRSTVGQPTRGGVHLAVVNAVQLSDVTLDPSDIGDLADDPASTYGTTEYDHGLLAPNLPQSGMTIGRTWADAGGASVGDVYFLRTLDRQLVKLAIETPSPAAPPTSASLHCQQIRDQDIIVDDLLAAPVTDESLAIPAAYGVTYVDFTATPMAVTLTGDLLHEPPSSRDWDIAFEATDAGVQVLLSPGVIFYNWTADPNGGAGSTDFDAATPPLY